MLAAFDAVAGPLSSVVLREKRNAAAAEVKKILVLELWHLGDVVLATAALQKLRVLFPDSRITLLAKDHARELLQHSPLVDEIVTFDFPWTAMSGKYDPSRYDTSSIREVVRRLRSMDFDLSIDCRMDLRSNLLTRSIGARRRIGYDFGGGGFLLTDAVTAPPADQHKIEDWMGLLEPVEKDSSRVVNAFDPSLTVTDEERADARRVLELYDVSRTDSVVGIHPGGSHEAKRWTADNFAAVARTLAERGALSSRPEPTIPSFQRATPVPPGTPSFTSRIRRISSVPRGGIGGGVIVKSERVSIVSGSSLRIGCGTSSAGFGSALVESTSTTTGGSGSSFGISNG